MSRRNYAHFIFIWVWGIVGLGPWTMELSAMSSFRENLAQSESGGNYNAKNSSGFTGKYQFGPDRLADFMKANGKQFTMAEFQSNPRLQEEVQVWHEGDILDFVSSSGLDKYFGQTVGGVAVTPGSLLGMAHLGGKTGMKKFVESGGSYDPSDSNGTRLSDYGKQFASSEGPTRPKSRPSGLVPQAEDKAGQAALQKGLAALYADQGLKSATPLGNNPVPGGFRASSKMSPLSRRGIPGAGSIERYSTPGGIDSLYKR
jgi:hypothetical protein